MALSALNTYLAKVFEYEDLKLEAQRKRGLAFELILWTIGMGVLYTIFYFILGLVQASYVTVGYVALSIINIYIYYLTKKYGFFKNFQLIIILLLPITEQVVNGGYTNSGAVGIAAILAPLGALIFTSVARARQYFYAFMLLLVLASVYELVYIEEPYALSRELSVIIFTMTMIFILAVIYFVVESFVRKIEEYQEDLSKEKEKSGAGVCIHYSCIHRFCTL